MGFFDQILSKAEAQVSATVSTDFRRILPSGVPMGGGGAFGGDRSPFPSPQGRFGNYSGSGSGFDINSFRQHFSHYDEVSKTDKFNVWIPVPKAVEDNTKFGMRELSLQCEMSELPSRDIQMIEYRHHAFTKRIPHMNQYAHANFTFYCNGKMLEKKLFDRWMDIMIPQHTGLVEYPQDDSGNPTYETDITCYQYNNMNNEIYSVDLIQAIPVSVAVMSQNWADDSVHRLSVSFAFLKWQSSQTVAGNQVNPNDLVSNFTNDPKSQDMRIKDLPDIPESEEFTSHIPR